MTPEQIAQDVGKAADSAFRYYCGKPIDQDTIAQIVDLVLKQNPIYDRSQLAPIVGVRARKVSDK